MWMKILVAVSSAAGAVKFAKLGLSCRLFDETTSILSFNRRADDYSGLKTKSHPPLSA